MALSFFIFSSVSFSTSSVCSESLERSQVAGSGVVRTQHRAKTWHCEWPRELWTPRRSKVAPGGSRLGLQSPRFPLKLPPQAQTGVCVQSLPPALSSQQPWAWPSACHSCHTLTSEQAPTLEGCAFSLKIQNQPQGQSTCPLQCPLRPSKLGSPIFGWLKSLGPSAHECHVAAG